MDLAPLTARRAALLAGIDLGRSGAALAAHQDVLAEFLERIAGELVTRTGSLPELAPRFADPEKEIHLRLAVHRWLQRLVAGPHDQAFWVDLAQIAREHARRGLHLDQMLAGMRLLERQLGQTLLAAGREVESLADMIGVAQAVLLQAHAQEREERFRRSERLAALGKIVAEVNHDLQNPLAVIRTSLYTLERHLGPRRDETIALHLDRMKRNAALAIHIARDLLDLTQHRRPETRLLDLNAFLRSAIREQDRPPRIVVETSLSPEVVSVPADPTMLQRVLHNLLRNAFQAMGGVGRLSISTTPGEGWVEIRVWDSGPGFPTGELDKIFEPLYTTRPEGAGLGLAIARKLVEAHAGTIQAANPEGGGAEVRITLPIRTG